MIRFFHVTKAYDQDIRAIGDVSFHVRKGEFVLLTGPSGAGKSTIMKLILGSLVPTVGQVLVLGRNVGKLSRVQMAPIRRKIGVVFQDFKLLNERTVADNIALVLEATGYSRREIRRRVPPLLRLVGLEHRAKSYPLKLSGGEQQRVAIARAVANDPLILLADEPTGNLDSTRSLEILDLFREIHARGTTVLLATHSREIQESIHARTLHIEGGRMELGDEA